MRINKRTIAVSTISLIVAGGVSAFAFIANNGVGTGHATQGTNGATLKTTVAVPKVEYGESGTITVSVQNVSGHSIKLSDLKLDPPSWRVATTGTCPAGSFTVTDLVKDVPDAALASNQTAQVATAKLNFVDLPKDAGEQTPCLGADVFITATAS